MTPFKFKSTNEISMMRTAISALGLLVVVPAVVILYIFRDNLAGKELVLWLLLGLAVLGFSLLFAFIRAISMVRRGLVDVSAGNADTLSVQGPTQLREMTDIINALNSLTVEFRENASQLENFIRQFATLAELTEVTARVPEIKDLLSLVLTKAMSASYARRGTIMLLNKEGTALEIVATEGWMAEDAKPLRLQQTLAERVVESGAPLLVHDAHSQEDVRSEEDPALYAAPSCLIMPLKTKASVLGAVCLSEKVSKEPFTEGDQQFLTVLLGQIGFAVENANLLQQARQAASDLKARVRTQEEALDHAHGRIAQAEKLSALGQLAGGVAHDFNNMLQAILGYTKLARRGLGHEDRRFRDLEEVRKAAERAATLTSQLLAFGRRQVLQPLDLDVNLVLADVLCMLNRVLGEHIEISTKEEEDLKTVHADPQQIEQVLLNLCINARDAMPGGGEISIRTRNVSLDEAFCKGHSLAHPGEYVQISVHDHGCGMDTEILGQIFEPFFTTKGVGQGTGLGLATVYGIIKQHNGLISVDSHVGSGSTFHVFLPAVNRPAEAKPRKEKRELATGSETILVAEDEETVRNLNISILEGAGYTVLAASDGAEAVRIFNENRELIDLAVIDAVMPKLSGNEVYDKLMVLKPDLRVLFSSGYSAEAATAGILQDGDLPLLQKPFDPDELLRKVRECLDANKVMT